MPTSENTQAVADPVEEPTAEDTSTEESTEDTAPQSENIQEVADPEQLNQDNDTQEGLKNNAAFAEMRKRNEALEAEYAQAQQQLQTYQAIELADQLGLDPQVLLGELEEENAKLERSRKEEAWLEEKKALEDNLISLMAEKQIKEDLEALQKINPKLKSLEELPDTYFSLIETGMVSPEEAYYASQAKAKAEKITPPDEIGSVNGHSEKTYITREEAEQMSQEEMVKNIDLVNRSCEKWR